MSNKEQDEYVILTPYEYVDSEQCCDLPEQSRRFTSPNSRLPREQLEALQRCIEEANDLLRSLGNEPDPENTRQLQLHFLQMRGLKILITLSNGDFKIEGKVKTAARDFIQLEDQGKMLFIGYGRILSIERKQIFLPPDEQELICIDPDIRTELVLNFGEFVSSRPKLVNRFFGNFLYRHLNSYLNRHVSIRLIDDQMVEGELVESEENKITLLIDDEIELPFENISFIEVC